MKIRNARFYYQNHASQVIDKDAKERNRAWRRHGCGGRRNQPLFMGRPILTSVFYSRVEARA